MRCSGFIRRDAMALRWRCRRSRLESAAAMAAQRAADAVCRSACRRIKSYLCEKERVAREGRREACECAVLLFCLIGTYVTVAARGNADCQRRRRSKVRHVGSP
ncbi:hypothetical protein Bamb_1502 [Burkholderia ambifaria AMMD]|uniref:Uncharacterized protein n=1 Tax=Burkholderia ambifaria (strain ATCC BAA-244 / DSM 16087 / CCUG 44356 / LMG 19182 / AMMD) TaxID=339670 RepID=Q0BFL3_BURCM|nr:hypothetical protein Bamb_1502 [Burkholderia ambifaria AMMD]